MAIRLNKLMKQSPSRGLSRNIFIRFFFVVVIFSIGLFIAFLTASFYLSRMIWYADDWIYQVLKPIDDDPRVVLLVSWAIGFFFIFLYFWRKTLRYIDTIADASKMLVSDNDDFIHLPTELKAVEERMNQIKQEAIKNARLAREAERRKNDLIVYLAHDLKTPLTSVIGYLTLLRDENQISEQLREKYVSISLEKAERLEELINEFFEITRFNLSQLSLEVSHVNLTRMLEQITYEFNPFFREKNISYSLEMEPDIEILCDINKMERVFDNLIRNAIIYSYENSIITIQATKAEDSIIIHFVNNGRTIPKEKLSRIFEQFYRLDASRGTKTGGAGLGLAIAKEIVELHGGAIHAHSENETIEFKITLPNAS